MSRPDVKIKFHPAAWAKIGWMIAKSSSNEVSGWGISSENDPLYVIDFQTVKQTVSGAETDMDDAALAEYMGDMAKKGIPPHRCMRIWIHTHPMSSSRPTPSGTDDTTLEEKTGKDSDWAVMIIFSKKMDNNYGRLQFRPPLLRGQPVYVELDVVVDWSLIASEKAIAEWDEEFDMNVSEKVIETVPYSYSQNKWWNQNKTIDDKPPLTFTDYKREFKDLKLPKKVMLSIFAYIDLREEGNTKAEIEDWFKGDPQLAQGIADALDTMEGYTGTKIIKHNPKHNRTKGNKPCQR